MDDDNMNEDNSNMILDKYYKLIYINIYLLIYDNMNEDDSNDYNDTTFQKR